MKQNKQLISRLMDSCWNEGDLSVADELIAADAISHDPVTPNLPPGPEGFKTQVRTYRAAFPDIQFRIDSQVAEGDMVVTRWTANGTHRGALAGIAPTNRRATVTGMQTDHIVNGKVHESWVNWDAAGLMRQIAPAASASPTAGAAAQTQRPRRDDGAGRSEPRR